jgi:hypothetical protein
MAATAHKIKQRAACLVIAQDKVKVPHWREGNDTFITDVRNQITEQEWRDAIYKAWLMILQEETNQLVSVYNLLLKEETK